MRQHPLHFPRRRWGTRRSLDARFVFVGPTPGTGSVAHRLHPTERLFAFLDDLYVVCRPDRVVDVHHILAVDLWSHAKIQIQHGKTQVWNRGGVEPTEIETLQAAAQVSDTDALVWRGDPTLPEVEQGMKILGTPLGHPSYVQSFLRAKTEDHTLLLERITGGPRLAVGMADFALLCFNESKLSVASFASLCH